MIFKEFFSIYYANKKNGKTIYKTFFANEDSTLFVQGFKIYDTFNDKWEFVCQRTLTKLSDYMVIDTNDESQVFKTDKEGVFDIELTNPFEKGYSKVIKAKIEVKFKQKAQESGYFSAFLERKLTPLKENKSLYVYLLLKIAVDFATLKFLNQSPISYDNFLRANLLQTINSNNFYYFVSSNQNIRNILKNILTNGTIDVTPQNIHDTIKLLNSLHSNRLNLNNYSLRDYLFLLKLQQDVSLDSAIFSAKQLTQKFKNSFTINKNYDIQAIKTQMLALPKTTKITLNINNKTVFSEEIVPVYRTDVDIINTNKSAFTYYFKNKKGYFSISFAHNFPFLTWSIEDKTDKTKVELGDIDNDFELIYTDDREFEIILEKD